jgi:tRNA (uracil-5-)-methyltransferase
MEDMRSAPTPLRNKCEFTFGYRYLFDKDVPFEENTQDPVEEPAKVPAVGFMVTGWAGGVSNPRCCPNIPSEVTTLVDIVDDFLSTSPLPPYDMKVHQGFWRTMTVRSSRRTQECMIIIMHTPPCGGVGEDDGPDYSEHFEKERARLVSVVTSAELPVPDQTPLKVTSIFFQEFKGLSQPPPEHPVQVRSIYSTRLSLVNFQLIHSRIYSDSMYTERSSSRRNWESACSRSHLEPFSKSTRKVPSFCTS